MKGQWGLLSAFIFAFIVAVFAVINVESVTVDYLFGTTQWPLVLVILASALIGGLAVGGFGMYHVFRVRRENRRLLKENEQLEEELRHSQEEHEDSEMPAEQKGVAEQPESGGGDPSVPKQS